MVAHARGTAKAWLAGITALTLAAGLFGGVVAFGEPRIAGEP